MHAQPTDAFDLLSPEALQELGLVVAALVLAYVLSVALTVGAARLTTRTASDLDDVVIAELRAPIFFGLGAVAVWLSIDRLHLPPWLEAPTLSLLGTAVAVVVGRRSLRVARHVIFALSRPEPGRVRLSPRYVPLAEYTARIALALAMLYAVAVAWGLETTLLSSSAGLVGLALGLAADGPLGHVIAGLFIAADRPCQLGDVLALPDGTRGQVTHIGLRAVRMLTLDGVEINLPNALVSGGQVVNETAGDDPAIRLSTRFVLHHGVELERVRALVAAMPALPGVEATRRPELRVLALDERGVRAAVLFWIVEPSVRLPATDAVNTWLYGQLNAAGLAFAVPQQVMHVDAVALAALTAGPPPR